MNKLFVMIMILAALFSASSCKAKTEPESEASESAEETETAHREKAVSTSEYKLKFAVSGTDKSTAFKGAEKLSEIIGERTDGRVTIKLYPNDTLSGGDAQKSVSMITTGVTDMDARSSLDYALAADERFLAISLPFMYDSAETAYSLLEGEAGGYYAELLEQNGLVLLGFGENGMRQLGSKERIKGAPDLKGLKLRTHDAKPLTEAVEKLGAIPVPMRFSDVFISLQQKTIDAQDSTVGVLWETRLYDLIDYLLLWNYSYDCVFFTMNKELFDSMPDDYRQIFLEAGAEAAKYQVELSRKDTKERLELFRENGMTIAALSSEARAEFIKAGDYVRELYEAPDKFGRELIELFTP